MPDLTLHDLSVAYQTEGDGFPLCLVPGPDGQATLWEPYVPLLAELCRVITYTVSAPAPDHDLAILTALLNMLELERLYLACQANAWSLALYYAVQSGTRLEGLLCIGTGGASTEPVAALQASPTPPAQPITIPTLILLEEPSVAMLPAADWLSAHCSRSTRAVLARAAAGTSAEEATPLHLGHAMMRFLLHCERQRNLVRGASFLL